VNQKDHRNVAAKPATELQRHGPLVAAMLRIYASNLRRSWRNTPHAAFVDAAIHLDTLMAVATMSVFVLAQLALSRLILPSLSISFGDTKYSRGMIIAIVASLIIVWIVDRRLKRFEFVPGADKAYDTSRDRVIVWIYFASGFALIILDMIASNYIRHVLPM
jgi:hypothetical protein